MLKKIILLLIFGFGAWLSISMFGGIVGGFIIFAISLLLFAYYSSKGTGKGTYHSHGGCGGDGGSCDGGGCGGGC